MDLKGALLKLAIPAWGALLLGVLAATYTGLGDPYLTPADVPVGRDVAVFGAFGLFFVGFALFRALHRRHEGGEWEAAGRQAGFQPTGGGTTPDLEGTVAGRPVRARVRTRRVKTGPEGGSKLAYTTLVETELDGPADGGLILGGDWGEIDAERGSIEFDDMTENADGDEGLGVVSAGDLHAVGTSEPVARAVADSRAQDALRSLGGLNLVYVGDAGRVVARYAEARNEELEGSVMEFPVDSLVEAVPGDAATVTVQTKRLIRDGDELRRLAEAVVATADAFEDASARTPSSG